MSPRKRTRTIRANKSCPNKANEKKNLERIAHNDDVLQQLAATDQSQESSK